MDTDFVSLLPKVEQITSAPSPADARLKALCYLLQQNVPHYDWVGFYRIAPDAQRELVLGPYEGAPTDHVRIPYGRGICGQVAETERTRIVDDVRNESNYLACSLDVLSEIVVPIFVDGVFVAQLDIDSHTPAAFAEEDRLFLGRVCDIVSAVFREDATRTR